MIRDVLAMRNQFFIMLKSKPDESRDKTLGNGYGSACGSRNEVNHGVATTV